MGKAEQNKLNKNASILNTAFSLFTSKGFSNTSISDIVNNAGVAKGTFYLYYKDKYDLRNKLIASKANSLFIQAFNAMQEAGIEGFEEQVIYIIDYIVDYLNNDRPLLSLLSKHLSWGVFRNNICSPHSNDEAFLDTFRHFMESGNYKFKDPEIMLYMIIELVSGTIYNPILYNQPCSLDKIKPYLYHSVRSKIQYHILSDENDTSESTFQIPPTSSDTFSESDVDKDID